MAGNQSRTVELQIKLQGVQSLQELENITAEINDELKQVAINSDEFNQLSAAAQQANSQLKTVGQSLEGVTSAEKADAVAKLGQGLVGAFQAAAGASLLFGEKTSEELQKVIQKVGGLFAITDGVKKLSEAFSAQNIARLKNLASSWGIVGNASKIAGVSMRTALISSGVGILIAGLATLLLSWNKITSAIKRHNDEKKRAEEIARLEKQIELNEKLTGEYEKEIDARKKIAEINKDTEENAKLDLDLLQRKRQDLQAQYNLINGEEDKHNGKLDDALAKQKDLTEELDKHQRLYDIYLDMVENGNGQAGLAFIRQEKQVKKTKELVDENQNLINEYNAQTQALQAQLDLLDKQIEATGTLANNNYAEKQIDAIDARINRLKNENDLMKEEGFQSEKIYKNNQEIVELQKERLDWQQFINGEIKQEDINQRETLGFSSKILREIETLRQQAVKDEIDKLTFIQEYNKALDEALSSYWAENDVLNGLALKDKERQEILDKRLRDTEREIELISYITQQQIEAIPFDKKGLEILKETLGLRSEDIKLLTELKGINIDISGLSVKQKLDFYNQVEALNDIYDKKVEILKTDDEGLKKTQESLQALGKMSIEASGVAFSRKKIAESERESLQELLATTTNEEKRLELLRQISAKSDEIAKFQNEGYAFVNDAVAKADEAKNIEIERLRIANEIDDLTQEKVNAEKKLTFEIRQQLRLSSRLKEFAESYAEEIQVTQDLIGATFEFLATIDDRKAEMIQRDIDAWKAAEEEKTRIANAQLEARRKAEDKSLSRIDELKEMLADAEGERYQDILDEIAAQEDAKNEAYRAEIDRQNAEGMAEWEKNKALAEMENQKALYEWQAAKKRKTAAIIDATIQTALAVIKALPNVFLAAATGVLGAVGIATIAAQPLPPKPEAGEIKPYEAIPYAKGGYTGDGDVNQPAGIVHAGEYVVPQSVMRNPRAVPMVQTLENMRVRGYAEGGIVTTPNLQAAAQNAIDYDMIGEKVAKALQDNPVFVSWTEWRDINSKMQFIGSRASLSKR